MAAFGTWLAGRPERGVTLFAGLLALAYAGLVIGRSSLASFYVIDDPFIHLALAENIARGEFGVNPGEAANPSSSILWPWLMAPFAAVGLATWAPLLVNAACFLASAWLLTGFVARAYPERGAQALVFAGAAFLSVNLFGVVFTGLEHSLHVLVSLAAVTRVIERRYDRVMFAALVLSPLVRFEGAAVLAFGIVAAVVDGRWRFAALAAAVVAVVVAAYVAWLGAMGLPGLPSSVLVKSEATRASGIDALLGSLWRNLSHNLAHPASGVSAVVLALAAWRRVGRERLVALGLLGFLALALTFGQLGGYPRYEVYVFSVVVAGALWLFRGELSALLKSWALVAALSLALVVINGSFGWHALRTTPQAARNIHQQQHQMHRFISGCWQKPVAANDLGWVSYRNDLYVLDLWGLGSEEARRARASGDPQWMGKLAEARGVDLAMIYSDWFSDIPAAWTKVGALVLTEASASPAGTVVDFYATRPEAAGEIARCLDWLKPGLPAGAEVRLQP